MCSMRSEEVYPVEEGGGGQHCCLLFSRSCCVARLSVVVVKIKVDENQERKEEGTREEKRETPRFDFISNQPHGVSSHMTKSKKKIITDERDQRHSIPPRVRFIPGQPQTERTHP
jgi:hypothetical protein